MANNEETQSLLSSIIAAHGDLERFTALKEIQVTFNFHGGALERKGYGGRTRQPTFTMNTQDPRHTTITNLGDGDATDRWIFTPEKVWIENAAGEVLQERLNPRDAFKGHVLTTKWDDLHLLYFISYAMYNYLSLPWLLLACPGLEIKELDHSHREPGHTQPWRVLQVTHPPSFPTHTRVQTFYFGSRDFLLKRMDYETDVLGGVAAHYVFDYKKVGGLLFPTTRRVVKRAKGTREAMVGAQTSFWLQYTKLRLVDGDGVVHEQMERVFTE